MANQIVQFTVTVEIDDDGDFDERAMRDGISVGIQLLQNEGGLTTIDDQTTVIHGFYVQHLCTAPQGQS